MMDKILDKDEADPTVDMSSLTIESAMDSAVQVINFNGNSLAKQVPSSKPSILEEEKPEEVEMKLPLT